MKIKEIFRIAMAGIILLAVTPDTAGQTFSVTFDLHDMCRKNQIMTYNRQTDCFTENGTKIIRLSGNNGYGIAWIRGMEFADGIIEVDIRTTSEIQQFAAGLAFHGLGSDTLDAVYLEDPFSLKIKKQDRTDCFIHPSRLLPLKNQIIIFSFYTKRHSAQGLMQKAGYT